MLKRSTDLEDEEGQSTSLEFNKQSVRSFMDWERLPWELEDKVLTLLSPKSLGQLRTVCKRWHSLPDDPHFQKLWLDQASLQVNSPYFIFCDYAEYVCPLRDYGDNLKLNLYHIQSGEWHRTDFQIPGQLPGEESLDEVLDANGGLFCIKTIFYELRKERNWLGVINPLTQCYRKLPPLSNDLHQSCLDIVKLVVDEASNNYKIIMVSYNKNAIIRFRTDVYDSILRSWTSTGTPPDGLIGKSVCVKCGNKLYATTIYMDTVPLFLYDILSGVWSRVWTNELMFGKRQLVENNGRVFMVGESLNTGDVESSMVIGIWVLDLKGSIGEWKEIARMPVDMVDEFISGYRKSITRYYYRDWLKAVGHGECIVLTSFIKFKRLMYNLSQQSWQWLPLVRAKDRQQYPVGLVGTLSLHTKV